MSEDVSWVRTCSGSRVKPIARCLYLLLLHLILSNKSRDWLACDKDNVLRLKGQVNPMSVSKNRQTKLGDLYNDDIIMSPKTNSF